MDIAILDEKSVLVKTVTVSEGDYRTDPAARSVALPDNHDMHQRVGKYKYDWVQQAFMPILRDPIQDEDRPGLAELLLDIAKELVDRGLIPSDYRNRLREFT